MSGDYTLELGIEARIVLVLTRAILQLSCRTAEHGAQIIKQNRPGSVLLSEHGGTRRSESHRLLVSEPNPLRPLRDLQYGLGEMVFGGCCHLEYMNIWCFNEPK